MRRTPMTFGALVIASGCSIWSGLDDFASEDPSADAGAPDAPPMSTLDGSSSGTPADADANVSTDGGPGVDGGDGAPALPNLHPFPDFESGCTGWGTYESVLSASGTARTGSGSCRVCTDGTDLFFTADDNGAFQNPPAGATYVAEAWVRTAPNETAPPYIALTFRTRNDNPFMEVEKSSEVLTAPTASWTKISATLSVTQTAQRINVVVGGESTGGACFLLDDVAIYRTK